MLARDPLSARCDELTMCGFPFKVDIARIPNRFVDGKTRNGRNTTVAIDNKKPKNHAILFLSYKARKQFL